MFVSFFPWFGVKKVHEIDIGDRLMKVLLGSMKKVVESSEIPVNIQIMIDSVEKECDFDNSNGFEMDRFVRVICKEKESLDTIGLVFENNVFSSK